MKIAVNLLVWLVGSVALSEMREAVLGKPGLLKTNFIEEFDLENLAQFTRERRFVVALFMGGNRRSRRASQILYSLSIKFEEREVFFVEIDTKNYEKKELEAHHLIQKPEIRLYVYGIPRRYTLPVGRTKLSEWIGQIVDAGVVKVTKWEEVHEVDRHYMVHVDPSTLAEHPAHFAVLARLITPITLYSGLTREQLEAITPGRSKHLPSDFPKEEGASILTAVRTSDGQHIDIPAEWSLPDKAKTIVENEFPQDMDCSDTALELVTKHKIPALVYFDQTGVRRHWEAVTKVSSHYREYLLTISVSLDKEDRCSQFFTEFLGVDQPESLRILDMHGKVKRYEFIGAFTENNLKIFMDNFVSANLRPYALNENLRPGAKHRGIPLANSRKFHRISLSRRDVAFFYVYGHDDPTFESDISHLKVIQSIFAKNKRFGVYLIDHLRNDLDGHYHPHTPFGVLVSHGSKLHHFEGPFSAEGLVKWIHSLVPALQIQDPAAELFEDDSL